MVLLLLLYDSIFILAYLHETVSLVVKQLDAILIKGLNMRTILRPLVIVRSVRLVFQSLLVLVELEPELFYFLFLLRLDGVHLPGNPLGVWELKFEFCFGTL